MINKEILYENNKENIDIIYNDTNAKLSSFEYQINQINFHKTNLIGQLEYYNNQTTHSFYCMNHFISINLPNEIAYYEQIYNTSLNMKLQTEMNLKLSDSQLINLNNQYYNLNESLYFLDFKYNIIDVNNQIREKFIQLNEIKDQKNVLNIVDNNIKNIIEKTFDISQKNKEKIISSNINEIIDIAIIESEKKKQNEKKIIDIKKFKEERKQKKKERKLRQKIIKNLINELILNIIDNQNTKLKEDIFVETKNEINEIKHEIDETKHEINETKINNLSSSNHKILHLNLIHQIIMNFKILRKIHKKEKRKRRKIKRKRKRIIITK